MARFMPRSARGRSRCWCAKAHGSPRFDFAAGKPRLMPPCSPSRVQQCRTVLAWLDETMPRKRQEAPLTEAKIAFMGAIDRLLAGEPKTEELRKRARKGRLKINVTTVSTEAGYARTYLYKFPSVRVQARLEEIMNPPSATRTAEDVIGALRVEIQELRRERDLAIDAGANGCRRQRKWVHGVVLPDRRGRLSA
jgi:hypothetical protein